jgi:hypothetical protein
MFNNNLVNFFTVKTEISNNGKVIGNWQHSTRTLKDYEINHVLNLIFNDHVKEYGNGIYAKVSAVMEEKTGVKLTEDAVKLRLWRKNKGKTI